MINRIDIKFSNLRNKKEGALITYVPLIDKELTFSLEIADMFIEAGSDILEVGLPTGFPWMDGKIMQRHHKHAIINNLDFEIAFSLLQKIRERYPLVPLVPMAFYSGVWEYGVQDFVFRLIDVNVDAVDSPDYPYFYLNDSHTYKKKLENNGIYFINPIDDATVKGYQDKSSFQAKLFHEFLENSKGFIFLMTTPGGISGAFGQVKWKSIGEASDILNRLKSEKKINLPVVAVCGISSPKEIYEILSKTRVDGVMVGSAISERILRGEKLERVEKEVKLLKAATILS